MNFFVSTSLLLSLFFLFALPALSLGGEIEYLSQVRSVKNVPEDLQFKNFNKVLEATGVYGTHCSATYISKHGHVLTAMHCLPLSFQKKAVPEIGLNLLLAEDVSVERRFRFYIGQGGKIALSGDIGHILLQGKGWYFDLNHMAAKKISPDLYTQIMNEGYGPPEDFAILKLEKSNTPCLKMSEDGAAIDETVWSISYPEQTSKIKNRPLWEDRDRVVYSVGKITRGVEDNEAFLKIVAGLPDEQRVYWQNYLKVMDRPGGLTTSLDVLSGASGSSVLNTAGEIVGLSNATQSFGYSNDDNYYSGTALGVSSRTIIDRARQVLDPEIFSQVFDCEN